MKASLYAVNIEGSWQWNCSIDVQTDMFYWFELYGAKTGILTLEPVLSLGQACMLRHKLAAAAPRYYGEMKKASLSTPINPLSKASKKPPSMASRKILTRMKSLVDPTHQPEPPDDRLSSLDHLLQALLSHIQTTARDCQIDPLIVESFQLKQYVYDPSYTESHLMNGMDERIYNELVQALQGRSLLIEELQQVVEHLNLQITSSEWMSYVQLGQLKGDIVITHGIHVQEQRLPRSFWKKSLKYACQRCGSGSERMHWTRCVFCGGECPYCEECLTMGRTRFCSLLVQGQSLGNKPAEDTPTAYQDYVAYIEPWGLSAAQTAASLEGLRFLDRDKSAEEPTQSPRSFLIWAVTGAGKTEMIFPFIQHELSRGGKVLVATPRKDVVLELRPRIAKAFSGHSVVTLYGGSEQRWEQGEITLATTHQLLRFRGAFDLVIIDEIDAYPYHNNPVLEYAARKVCKARGDYILLSATPPRKVRQAIKRGAFPHVKVPVRYHRHPLPIPEIVAAPTVKQILNRGMVPAALLKRIQMSMDRGAQVFLFVGNIQYVGPLVQLLGKSLRLEYGETFDVNAAIEGTSSKDPNRTEKVQRFRDKQTRLLVTTTILERGVTIPKSDVYILDADSGLFDEAALVQMAGRAGRSAEDPAGKVYFAGKERTNSQSEAIKQIKKMNKLARKQGYFKGGHL